MKMILTFFLFGVCLVYGAPLGPHAVQVSRYIGPSVYPGYYIYNYLQVDESRGIPIAIYPGGNPGSLQPAYTYFGTPVYDYRFQINQILPGFPSYQPPPSIPVGQPTFVPAQVPAVEPTTEKPSYPDDGIEKLDDKLEPASGSDGNSHREDDDDTVTIDAV